MLDLVLESYRINTKQCTKYTKGERITERRTLVSAFKSNESSKNEEERQQTSKNKNGVKKCTVRNMTSCDFDLHQVRKSIAARDCYTSHAR